MKQEKKPKPVLDLPASYREMLDNIRVGVFRSTPQGKIVALNPAAVQLLGYESAMAVMKQSAADIYADRSSRKMFLEHLTGPQNDRPIELQLKRSDGSIIRCAVTATPVWDESGNMAFIDGTIEDVTERRRAEARLRQQNLYMQCLQDVMLDAVSRPEPWDVLETV